MSIASVDELCQQSRSYCLKEEDHYRTFDYVIMCETN